MAMTAWSAKVLSSAICFSVERSDFGSANQNYTNRTPFAEQRRGQYGASTRTFLSDLSLRKLGFDFSGDIMNVNRLVGRSPLGQQANHG